LAEKIIFTYSWDPGEVSRVETVFFLASVARDMGLDTSIFFFLDGVVLARKGIIERVSDRAAKGLEDSLKTGIKIYVCENSLRAKRIPKEEVVEGIKIIGFVTFIDMALEAKTVINL